MLFYFACEAAGAFSARHSLLPFIIRGRNMGGHNSRTCGEIAKVCLVIACDKRGAFAHGSESDEAIHLRSGNAERWIASLALAMTRDGAQRYDVSGGGRRRAHPHIAPTPAPPPPLPAPPPPKENKKEA